MLRGDFNKFYIGIGLNGDKQNCINHWRNRSRWFVSR